MLANSPITTVIATLAVIGAGQLAGILLGTGMDQYTQRNLPEISWTAQHQTVDARFSRVMPVCFNATALLLIASAVLAKGLLPAGWRCEIAGC